MSAPEKPARVMWSFYTAKEAKRAVEKLAASRGEPASRVLRHLLSIGMRHQDELPPATPDF